MTPTEILTISSFLQNHIDSTKPTYDGSTFGEWEITDKEAFIDAVCYVINANVTRYFYIDENRSEHFGFPCIERYATNVLVALDAIDIVRLEADGDVTTITVPIKLIEQQSS